MNRMLQSLFAAELKKLQSEGIVGEAIENYLSDHRHNIKIPNVIYCVLQMLSTEYENQDVMYIEYCGRCPLWNQSGSCQKYEIRMKKIKWRFWFVKYEDILNITYEPVNSLDDSDYGIIEDNGANVVLLNLYAKLAYQCMVVYDTRYKCYLPPALFQMAKYVLFLLSYKAFYAALKSAVKHQDDEATNYVIREVFATILELEKFKLEKDERSKVISLISRMRGSEKAAVARMIADWDLNDELLKKLEEIVDKFIIMLSHPETRELVEKHEKEMKRVLGGKLFGQMKKCCKRNSKII